MGPCPGAQTLDGWVSRLVNRQGVHMPCVTTYDCVCVCVFGRGERRKGLGLELTACNNAFAHSTPHGRELTTKALQVN